MKRSVVIATLLLLGGCQTKPVNEMSYTEQNVWASGIVKACRDQKVPEPQMNDCIRVEAIRDMTERHSSAVRSQRMREALADGLTGMGASMQGQAATYSPPVNCTSRLAGTNVGQPTRIETSCY
jgi:hypothetical protein